MQGAAITNVFRANGKAQTSAISLFDCDLCKNSKIAYNLVEKQVVQHSILPHFYLKSVITNQSSLRLK
jgi:hypothetical protein